MNINRLLKIGKTIANRVIKSTYKNTLIATWEELPLIGVYDEISGQYLDSSGKPLEPIEMRLEISALFDEAPNIIYKYAKYGVRPETDVVAIVPEDTVIPDTTAVYMRAGDSTKYKLRNLILKADIGVAPGEEEPDVAYKILHLRNGNAE